MAKTKEGTLIEECILRGVPKEKRTKVMNAIRLALTGKPDGLPVGDIMYLIGAEETQKRLDVMFQYSEKTFGN